MPDVRFRRVMAAALAAAGAAALLAGGPAAATAATSASATTAATVPVTATGPTVAVSPATLGLNGQNTSGPVYDDDGFARAIASYGPGTLRYPGGTAANFWDWRTGWYQPGGPWAGQPSKRIDNTLATFASVARRTGAIPVFDLNLVTYKGRIATDADVPDMIDDSLAFLDAAKDLGVPIRRVELGNELYLNGPQPGSTRYQQRFPSPGSYAATADRYAAAITARFPDAQVAATAAVTDYVPGINARRKNWNAGMLPALHRGEAVTLHLNVRVHDAGAAPRDVIGTMIRQTDALKANELPRLDGRPAWVTEFNMADSTSNDTFRGTWLHGVASGTLALSLVPQPGVAQLGLNNITGSAQIAGIWSGNQGFGRSGPATTPDALTANGVVVGTVQTALTGADSARALSFAGAPPLGSQGAPGLIGIAAKAGDRTRLVVLNLTGGAVTLDVGGLVPGRFDHQEAWAAPATRIAGPGDVHRSSGTASGTITLPAYGVASVTG